MGKYWEEEELPPPFYNSREEYTLKTQKELIYEIHQGVFGVPNTEDKGLYGDLKELKKEFKEQNYKVTKLSKRVWFLFGLLASSGTGAGIWSLLSNGG